MEPTNVKRQKGEGKRGRENKRASAGFTCKLFFFLTLSIFEQK